MSFPKDRFFLISLILILASAIFRCFFLHPTFSDENFYFNVAKNIVGGKVPYKDFFFAHPPLHVFLLSLFFRIFGTSFLVGKVFTLIFSSLSPLILYLILKKIYDEKTGLIGVVIFLLSPTFLSFSLIGYGMWETLFFILTSLYLITLNRLFLASLALLFASLTKYLSLIYFPFLMILVYLRKKRIFEFSFSFLLFFLTSILLLFRIFGMEYLDQTFLYHLTSKISLYSFRPSRYLGIEFFLFFLAGISILISIAEKDRILLFFALTPLVADGTIFLFMKVRFYHYFLISLPFYLIAVSRSLFISRDLITRLLIISLLLFSIISNVKTIDFYLNPAYAKKFHQVARFIENNTDENGKIFGEPVVSNYVSFTTGRSMSANYLDSYLSHLRFEGEEKVIKKIEEDKPQIFIEMKLNNNYYYLSNPYFKNFILKNFELRRVVGDTPTYLLYAEKLR